MVRFQPLTVYSAYTRIVINLVNFQQRHDVCDSFYSYIFTWKMLIAFFFFNPQPSLNRMIHCDSSYCFKLLVLQTWSILDLLVIIVPRMHLH